MSVYLVGAGPGDPGLLTRRGAELLGAADVVVHDRLVDAAVLALARPGARLIDVGKRPGAGAPGGAGFDQAAINSLLVELGRDLSTVVRLKGGDPYLFGRGGEEALALQAAGVAYEVVPGVSSAFAVPASAGVPVTHRELSASVAVVNGHDLAARTGDADLSAATLSGGTLVVVMAAAAQQRVASLLLERGRPPATPVLAVRKGTTPEQASWRGTLAGLAAGDAASALGAPAGEAPEHSGPVLFVVGEVAALQLSSYEHRPLAGWTVAVTRAAGQATPVAEALQRAGARPLLLPTIELAPPSDGGAALAEAARRARRYSFVVFTSANAVHALMPLLHDARDLPRGGVAAIGPGTAAALAAYGVVADLLPERYVAEGLLEVFPPADSDTAGTAGSRGAAAGEDAPSVLLPRAAEARAVLPEGLRRLGYRVDIVEAYVTVPAQPDGAALEALRSADAVLVTSSSTVKNLHDLAGPDGLPPVVASIGPVTSATARALGIEVAVEAERSTIEGLVAALAGYAVAQRDHGRRPSGARPRAGKVQP